MDDNPCSDCAGTGYIDGEICSTCGGSGQLPVIVSDDDDEE